MNAKQIIDEPDVVPTAEARHVSVRQIRRSGCREAFLMFRSRESDDPAEMFSRMDRTVAGLDGKVVRMDPIGLCNTTGTVGLQQRYCCDCENCRLNTTTADGGRACPVTGLYVDLISNTPVEPVWLGGQIVGTVYEDEHARYCQLNEIHADPGRSPETQTRQVLERMEAALDGIGMEFSHVIRAWFYLDDILAWYPRFNRVRDRFFTERDIYKKLVPASTGIGASNASGSAVVASLTAVLPRDGQVTIEPVASPLQCPALDYGSSFSRAVELATPDYRQLLISGTASIAMDGKTAYVGDVENQVAFTMEVVGAILRSRGMDWADVTRAAAYFTHFDDLPVFDRYCEQNGLTGLPAAVVASQVCRDDLLFEIEVDGVRGTA